MTWGTGSYLDSDGFEDRRMSQRKFDEFFDDGHLLGTSTDVCVADPIHRTFVVLRHVTTAPHITNVFVI